MQSQQIEKKNFLLITTQEAGLRMLQNILSIGKMAGPPFQEIQLHHNIEILLMLTVKNTIEIVYKTKLLFKNIKIDKFVIIN